MTARIGVVADVHLGYGETEAVLATLRRCLDDLHETFGADRLVVLGDLILEADAAEADAERVERLRRTFERYPVPTTYVRGNHDVEGLSSGDLTALLGQPPCGEFRVGDAQVLYVSSAAPRLTGSRGEVGRSQRDYLRRALEAGGADLLFVHHPICHLDLSRNAWFAEEPERAVCGDKREVNATLDAAEGDVALAVSGHVHEPHRVSYEGRDSVVLNAFNREYPGADVSGTYAEIEIDDRISIETKVDGETRRSIVVDR